jgi:hypothetical protein
VRAGHLHASKRSGWVACGPGSRPPVPQRGSARMSTLGGAGRPGQGGAGGPGQRGAGGGGGRWLLARRKLGGGGSARDTTDIASLHLLLPRPGIALCWGLMGAGAALGPSAGALPISCCRPGLGLCLRSLGLRVSARGCADLRKGPAGTRGVTPVRDGARLCELSSSLCATDPPLCLGPSHHPKCRGLFRCFSVLTSMRAQHLCMAGLPPIRYRCLIIKILSTNRFIWRSLEYNLGTWRVPPLPPHPHHQHRACTL